MAVLIPITADDLPLYDADGDLATHLSNGNLLKLTDLNRDGVIDPGAVMLLRKSATARINLHAQGPWVFADTATGRSHAELFRRWAIILASRQATLKRLPVTTDAGRAMLDEERDAIKEMQVFAANPPVGATQVNATVTDDNPDVGEFQPVTVRRAGYYDADEFSHDDSV